MENYTDQQIMEEFQKRFFDGIITREWAKAYGFKYFSTYGNMQMYIKEGDYGLSSIGTPEVLYLCFWINPNNDTVQTIKFNDVDITKISEFKELFKQKYQRDFSIK